MWYQPLNANSWLGLAIVLCHRGQTVWLLANGEIKKFAAYEVKLYKLIERNTDDNCKCDKVKKKVILEDGLAVIDNLISPDKEEKREAMKTADAE